MWRTACNHGHARPLNQSGIVSGASIGTLHPAIFVMAITRRQFNGIAGAMVVGMVAGAGPRRSLADDYSMDHALQPLLDALKQHDLSLDLCVYRYDADALAAQQTVAVDATGVMAVTLGASKWRCELAAKRAEGVPDGFDLEARFTLESGSETQAGVGVAIRAGRWSTDHYLLMPAAAYNGNRFLSRPIPYSPRLLDPADIGPDKPTIVTDIPRLNIGAGPSRLQLLTGDLATPSVGFHDPHRRRGLWMLAQQATRMGDSGFDVSEAEDRAAASITLLAPGVRQSPIYQGNMFGGASPDRGAAMKAGDTLTVPLRLVLFECPELQGLFDRFLDLRERWPSPTAARPTIPFSATFGIQQDKYNQQNWNEHAVMYATEPGRHRRGNWATGWTGGMMVTLPLLADGDATTRDRVLRHVDHFLRNAVAPSGLFFGRGTGDRFMADLFYDRKRPHTLRWHLIRRNGDALYYILKKLALIPRVDASFTIPDVWHQSLRGCCDALVGIWDKHGQFGQFVDQYTGDIVVGGSACGSLIPGALALASKQYGHAPYLKTAVAAAEHFRDRCLTIGVITGGPGDALQNPDSESTASLVESYVTLAEVTGEARWWELARRAASQLATWCMNYDFAFPPTSTFGKLGMQTTGTVFANTQNKHSAPGICTHAGAGLLKVYRATGDARYLRLLGQIASSIPQYMSRADRPIAEMPPGWINERVNTSDWAEGVGEIFFGSTWSEVAMLLTSAELPGLYVQPDTGLVSVLDHVTAERRSHDRGRLTLTLHNPTAFAASVKVLCENATAMRQPLGQNFMFGRRRIDLQPGERRDEVFEA